MTQGERIREVRKTLGLTLEKFGEKIGMKKNSVSQIESGKNSVTEQVVKSICREFNVDYMANPDKIERKWYVVDAEGCTLGRLASGVASVLRGKNKPQFTPHVDTGDYVIVVNADKIKVTGKKLEQKIYYNHSEYVGGMKETTLKEMLAKKPEKVIELAVKGMLPKGPLGRAMNKKLFVYAGPEHKHEAQKPEVLTF